jgi:hypothetical protein
MSKRRVTLPLLLSRAYFRRHAQPLSIALGQVLVGAAKPREYLTGSLGWQWVCKTQLKVGDCYVWVQVNLSMTVIGSKDLPTDGPTPGAQDAGQRPDPAPGNIDQFLH